MRAWRQLHLWAWWVRSPLKLAAFVVVVVVVLYPKLWLLPTWVARLRDMNQALEPDARPLAGLEDIVRARLGEKRSPSGVLLTVQQTVYERIPYAWDWDVWGVVDYLPTVDEVFEKGREDCDGRAVVAASLLRRMGYEAWLASDLKHMWVVTPNGETMSPGEGEKTLEGGPTRTRMRMTLAGLGNLARGLTYGMAVFPLTRQLLILAALCGLTMHPHSSVRRRVAGCLLLLLALGLLHDSGGSSRSAGIQPVTAWAGSAAAVAGWLLLAVKAGGRHWRPAQPG